MPKSALHVSIPTPRTPNFSHPITPSPVSIISAHTAESSKTISIAFDRSSSDYEQISFHDPGVVLAGSYPTSPDSVYSRSPFHIDDFVALKKNAGVRLETSLKDKGEKIRGERSHRLGQDRLRPEGFGGGNDENDTRWSTRTWLLPCPFHDDPLCNKILRDHEEQQSGICGACTLAMTPELVLETSPHLGPFTPTSLLVSPARALWLSRSSEVSIPPRKSSLTSIVKVYDTRVNSAGLPIWDDIVQEDATSVVLSNQSVADPREMPMPVAKTIVWEPRRGSLISNVPSSANLTSKPPAGIKAAAAVNMALLSPVTTKIESIIDSYKLSASQWEAQHLRSPSQIKQQQRIKSTKKPAGSRALKKITEKKVENVSDEDEKNAKEAYHRHLERRLRDLGHSQKCHCKQCSQIGEILALACI